MCEHVVPGIVVLAESAVADVAAKGPDAAVHELVRLEVSGRRKGLVANVTLVRLLLKLNILMFHSFIYARSAFSPPCCESFCGSRGCWRP
jgi:hypothetical protein